MRISRTGALLLLAACRFDASPLDVTEIRCQGDTARCAELGLVCSWGYCAREQPPYAVALTVGPQFVGRNGTVNAHVEIDGGQGPWLVEVVATRNRDRAVFSGDSTDFVLPAPQSGEGEWEVEAVVRDRHAHAAGATGRFALDLTAPDVVSSSVELEGPPTDQDRYLPAVTAITVGSRVTVRWQSDEQLVAGSVEARESAATVFAALPFDGGAIDAASFVHLGVVAGARQCPERPLQLWFRLADRAGNISHASHGPSVLLDSCRAELKTSASMKLILQPFGDTDGGAPSAEVSVGSDFANEPVTLLVFNADEPGNKLPLGIGQFSPGTPTLVTLTADRVSSTAIQAVDRAGNASTPKPILDVELTVVPSPRDLTAQRLELRPFLTEQRTLAEAIHGPASLEQGPATASARAAMRPLGEANSPNTAALLIFDSERGRVVAWGGTPWVDGQPAVSNPPAHDDLFELVGSTWNHREVAGPMTRPGFGQAESFGFAHDPRRGRDVRYEGLSTRETWAYDGTEWDRIGVPLNSAPPPRESFSFAYSASLGSVVLFGGRASSQTFDDLWALRGDRWEQVDAGASPPPRAFAALASTPSHGLLMVGGVGSDGGALGDVWSFRKNAWVFAGTLSRPLPTPVLVVVDDVPPGSAVLFEPSGNAFWAALGEDGGIDFQRTPAWDVSGGLSAAVYDPVHSEVVAIGQGKTARRRLDGGSWWLAVQPSPQALAGASATYEPRFDNVMVVGGVEPNSSVPTGTTWCLSHQEGWKPLASTVTARRDSALAAFDGGLVLSGGIGAGTVANERWVYTPTAECQGTWAREGVNSSSSRSFHQGVTTGAGVVFLGGAVGTPVTAEVFDGVAWSEVSTNLPYQRPGLGFDPTDSTLWALGGVNMPSALYRTRTPTAWQPAPAQLANVGHRLLFDRGLSRMLSIGGASSPPSGELVRIVEPTSIRAMPLLDLSEKRSLGTRSFPSVAYDTAAERTLMWGAPAPLFWELRTTGQSPAVAYHISLDALVTSPASYRVTELLVEGEAGADGQQSGAALHVFDRGRFVPLRSADGGWAANQAPAASAAALLGQRSGAELESVTRGQGWLTVAAVGAPAADAGAQVSLRSLRVRLKYTFARAP